MEKIEKPKAAKEVVIKPHSTTDSSFPRFHAPRMSNTIRPVRIAAQLAAIRINEFCKFDNANSDSDDSTITTTDIGITRARENGYDNALYVVRYLIDEFDAAKFEDERTDIATKMFKFLNANPGILIHESNFREAVIKKIADIESLIDTKHTLYESAEYSKAIKMMKASMFMNVRNSKMRTDIYKHLNEISNILNDYSSWSHRTQLRTEMNKLSKNIQKITSNPKKEVILN